MAMKNCRILIFLCVITYLVAMIALTKFYVVDINCNLQQKPYIEFTIKVQNGESKENLQKMTISGKYNENHRDILSNKVSSSSDEFNSSENDDNLLVKNENIDIIDYSKTNLINTDKNKNQQKYIFSLRYYEQLTRGTMNLLSLASLAAYSNRHVVMPFVNNSRFSGIQSGASMSRFKEIQNKIDLEKGLKFSNLSTYFDVDDLNEKLSNHGYSTLVPLEEFRENCQQIDTVVHFLYSDSDKNLLRWYKLTPRDVIDVRQRIKNNGGYGECNFLKRSKINTFLAAKVQNFICVDPEMIKTAKDLEDNVLKSQRCVAIVMWKGDGLKRTHFENTSSISKELRPSHLKFHDKLKDIAYAYIRDVIKRPFISVHVRIERQLVKNGIVGSRKCLQKLAEAVLQRRSSFHLKKIFLASDLGTHGSDTLKAKSELTHQVTLEKELFSGLEQPFTFDPKQYGLYDRGQIAIVEMHILSLGESLFTLGRGNFQDWIMEMFLSHNAEDKSLIYRVCEIER